jgi:putative peptidoglycan lipid II flippase
MIPGTLGVAAFQINVLATQGIAFWVDPQINASFDYAVRLMELPQGMFGISLATYLLPTLAGLAAEKNFSEFRGTLRQGLGTLLFANLIASVLLVVLAEPIVRLIFEHGKFTAASTGRATLALMCLAPGLIAFSTVNILARAFYALGDVKTPMKISMFCLGVNLIITMALVHPLRQGGLGIANTATSLCNVTLLFYALRRKLGKLEMESLRATLLPLAVAGVLAGLIAWWGGRFWERSLGHATLAGKIGSVFAPALAATILYALLTLAFKVPSAIEMRDLLLRRIRRG